MKKYLIFGISAQLGGVETFIFNYIEKMKEQSRGDTFDFIVFDQLPEFIESTSLKEDTFYVVPSRIRNPLGYYLGLRNILSHKKYDVLWYNACTLSDITLLKMAKKSNIPRRIIHSHNSKNMGGKIVGLLHSIHKKEIGEIATDFFACSKEAGDYMFSYKGCTEKVHIVKNAINLEKYQYNETIRKVKREELGVNDELLIGNVGRFHFQKNHEFLIDIFKRVQEKDKTSKLLLVGDGELKDKIIQKTERLGIRENVIFLGKRRDVNELLQAMDVFLMPSLFEGLPFALVEAQAAALPCVVSKTISKEARITDEMVSLDLKETSEMWADVVVKISKKSNRKSNIELFREKGFDISYNAKKILEYLD